MKIENIIIATLLVILLGGFMWFALTDVTVKQIDVSEAVSNDRFSKNA